ncbi:HTH-type transcriptional regulator LysM [Candidatus Bilamarchaeum dharawalense]|uniref:HTH-type transcriptional regulator LysM n=1 Tax=Candidatus Bilamarchaeum dharawalense TaxID=2885759 RepID=A0A5E4LVD0_9ARCH|nr:HTH-type transcriptional regulator LysM [Candidatus Bilamarchaeum dharawalense]
MKRDEKDEKILSMLTSNSRASNVEIARAVDLTEGAVRNRIDHLIKNNSIKRFTIETSGGTYFGIVMLKAKHDVKKMMTEISESKLAKDAYEISGDYDGCVILEGMSLEEIDGKIDEIRKLNDVQDTKTFISFKRW